MRLKLFTFLESLIVWLRELKLETAWYCVLCILQFLLTRGNLKLPLLRILRIWSSSCLIKSISWLIRPLMHLYTCTHLWNRLFYRGSHLRATNASVEDEHNGLFKITLHTYDVLNSETSRTQVAGFTLFPQMANFSHMNGASCSQQVTNLIRDGNQQICHDYKNVSTILTLFCL